MVFIRQGQDAKLFPFIFDVGLHPNEKSVCNAHAKQVNHALHIDARDGQTKQRVTGQVAREGLGFQLIAKCGVKAKHLLRFLPEIGRRKGRGLLDNKRSGAVRVILRDQAGHDLAHGHSAPRGPFAVCFDLVTDGVQAIKPRTRILILRNHRAGKTLGKRNHLHVTSLFHGNSITGSPGLRAANMCDASTGKSAPMTHQFVMASGMVLRTCPSG